MADMERKLHTRNQLVAAVQEIYDGEHVGADLAELGEERMDVSRYAAEFPTYCTISRFELKVLADCGDSDDMEDEEQDALALEFKPLADVLTHIYMDANRDTP